MAANQALSLLISVCNIRRTAAASFCVLGMKGANECLEAVVEMYNQCAVTDTETEVVWRPPTEAWQMHADALGKYEDTVQRELNPSVYECIRAQPGLGGPACP